LQKGEIEPKVQLRFLKRQRKSILVLSLVVAVKRREEAAPLVSGASLLHGHRPGAMSEDVAANAVPLSRLDAFRQLDTLERAAHLIADKLDVQGKSLRADPLHDGHSAWDITQHKTEVSYLKALRPFIAYVCKHEALLGQHETETIAAPYEKSRDEVLANVQKRATEMMSLVRVHLHGGPKDGEV